MSPTADTIFQKVSVFPIYRDQHFSLAMPGRENVLIKGRGFNQDIADNVAMLPGKNIAEKIRVQVSIVIEPEPFSETFFPFVGKHEGILQPIWTFFFFLGLESIGADLMEHPTDILGYAWPTQGNNHNLALSTRGITASGKLL